MIDPEKLLVECRQLTNKAVEGPWSVHRNTSDRQESCTVLDANGMWVAECGPAPDDASFIAFSREAVPALLDLAAAQARRVAELEAEVARLAEELEDAEREAEKCRGELASKAQVLKSTPAPDPKETATLRQRIQDASNHNFNVAKDQEQAKQRDMLAAAIEGLDEGIKKLTAEIDKIDADKKAFLASTPLPVDGLDIGPDGVRFNGVPLEQASGAEQLRVALALAIAASPKLRDVWVRDGALLDDQSLAMLRGEAEQAGVRVWVERVSDRDADAIIIHDGRVLRDPTKAVGEVRS